MVAKGDDDKPTQVPELILESQEEVKRCIEAMRMKEIKHKVKDEMDDAKSNIHVDQAMEILKGERCLVRLKIKIIGLEDWKIGRLEDFVRRQFFNFQFYNFTIFSITPQHFHLA